MPEKLRKDSGENKMISNWLTFVLARTTLRATNVAISSPIVRSRQSYPPQDVDGLKNAIVSV